MSKSQIKREALISAGMNILHMQGYNGTSVNDIVKAAEMPKGSFYFYFESKEQFVTEAIDYYAKLSNEELMVELQNENKSARQRLMSFYDLRIRINIDRLKCNRGCLITNLAGEMSDINEVIRKRAQYYFDLTVQTITKTIREAKKNGEIQTKESAVALATAIEESWRGALISMKACQCEGPLNNFRNIIVAHILK